MNNQEVFVVSYHHDVSYKEVVFTKVVLAYCLVPMKWLLQLFLNVGVDKSTATLSISSKILN